MTPPTDQTLTVDGLEAHLLRAGTSGPAVLLLHGWGSDANTWRRTLAALATDHRVWAVDLPGFGQSQVPPGTWKVSDFARFVFAIMDVLVLPEAAIVGRSFGGRVAIKMAATAPDRVSRVILVNSAGLRPAGSPVYWFRLALAKLGKVVLDRPLTRRLFEKLRDRSYGDRVRESQNSRMTVETFKAVVSEDLSDDLRAIRAQTLVVHGEVDDVVPVSDAYRMHDLLTESQLHVFPKAGHQAHTDAGEEFDALVGTFLAPGELVDRQ